MASSVVGTADQADAPLPDRRRETGDIADGAAADGDHAAAAVDLLAFEEAEHVVERAIDFERSLAGIAWMVVFRPARLIALATFVAQGRTLTSVMIAARWDPGV